MAFREGPCPVRKACANGISAVWNVELGTFHRSGAAVTDTVNDYAQTKTDLTAAPIFGGPLGVMLPNDLWRIAQNIRCDLDGPARHQDLSRQPVTEPMGLGARTPLSRTQLLAIARRS
jgi:hypothetical protein